MKLTKARLQEIIKEEIDAVTEAEGPEKALGKWAKMFPRAAAALEKMGATIEDIKKAIDDAQPAAGSPEDEVRRKMRAYGSAGAISSDIMGSALPHEVGIKIDRRSSFPHLKSSPSPHESQQFLLAK